ncbi:MAG: peptide chain release factor N(5)-glutamine methyltransferase [Gemmatimonadota bacterium]
MTVAELLATANLPTREARSLLAFVLGARREWLIAHPDAAVDETRHARFAALIERRLRGEPVAYLLGAQEFYGRDFRVNPAVLIPRPETELLVDTVLAAIRAVDAPRVLDLGTGSGCVAITLALERPDAVVTGTDRSAGALAVARDNAKRLGARVAFVESDWYARIEGRFDAIVANPPYIASGDPHLPALRDEPLHALTDHTDGLAHLRAIVAGASPHLRPGGVLMVEHGYDQGAAVRALFDAAGFQSIETRRDAAGLDRICSGRVGGRTG